MIARRVLILVVLGLPAVARADKTKEATAQALFEAGRALVEAGQIDDACEKFEQSQQLDPQTGTKLNLADCRVRQDRLVEAYRLFVEGEAESTGPGKTSGADVARRRLAEEKRTALEAKLVRINLHILDADVTVRVGPSGKLEERPRKTWSKIVVAPGKVMFEVSSPGRVTFRDSRDTRAGEAIEIDVPSLAVASTKRWFRTPQIIATTGGGLLLVSVMVGLHAKSRYNTAVTANDPAAIDSAQSEADVGTAFAVVGVVTATIGAVMYVKTRKHVTIAPTANGSVGIMLGGRY